MKNLIFAVGVLFTSFTLFAQNEPFEITLEPVVVPELGGLQSYAFEIPNGKWLV